MTLHYIEEKAGDECTGDDSSELVGICEQEVLRCEKEMVGLNAVYLVCSQFCSYLM